MPNKTQPNSGKIIDMKPIISTNGKETYEMSEVELSSKDSDNTDFSDCRAMVQSAKNMSGGLRNIQNELKNLGSSKSIDRNNNVPCAAPCNIGPTEVIGIPIPFLVPCPIPLSQPFRNSLNPYVEKKPRLIDVEIPNISTAEELRKWLSFLNIIYFYKKNYISFLKELFQGGEFDQNNNRFKHKDFIVILESQQFVKELQIELPFGAWYNKYNLDYGLDILNLCIYHLKIGFDRVITMYSKVAENLYNLKKIKDKDEQPWNIQVKIPLIPYDFHRIKINGAKKIHESKYYTAYHIPLKIVEFWELLNGEIVSIYYTLWRPWNSQKYHSQMINPHPPYILYNLHLINDFPEAEIIFLKNERIADFNQKKHDPNNHIFTSCFGGIKNLKEADLKPLFKKKFFIGLAHDSPDIRFIPQIINTLIDAGVKELNFSFDEGKNWISHTEFMTDPTKWGCDPEPQNDEENYNNKKYKIVPSGVKIEGEDNESTMLLSPIIETGDIVWIYGKPGSFKSYIGYSIAIALSVGNKKILKFTSGTHVRVGYFDAEMRPNKSKKRLNMIMKGFDLPTDKRPFDLYLVMDDSGANTGTDISTEEWQDAMKDYVKDLDVLIFDNFQFLAHNSTTAATNAIHWFKRLSQQGKTIIVFDHENRKGELQGSIIKLRASDLVIRIEPNEDIRNQVNMFFEKHRDLSPQDTLSFDIEMLFEDGAFRMEIVDGEDEKGQPLSDRNLKIALVQELTNERSVDRAQIMKMLQIKQAAYYKYLKEQLPKLTEQQKLQVKSEADRLLEAIKS